jgi:hypothetical protein
MKTECLSFSLRFFYNVVKAAFVLSILLTSSDLFAQQPDETDLQEVIENVARGEDSEEFLYDGSIDDLENLRKHPVNLNKATREA